MKYGQFCPVSKAAEILGEKWTLLIVREFLQGATRFSQIQRGLSKISPTLLNKRLDSLQQHGIIVRRKDPEKRSHIYQLTEAGRELMPIVMHTAEWGMRWARGQMTDEELDVDLLMSDIERRIDSSKLPDGQTVVKFTFTDLADYGEWWIKVEGSDIDLCIDNPGTEVDIYITSDLRTLTEIWMGDLSINKAKSSNRLKLVGQGILVRNLKSWLGLHQLSHIRSLQN